MAQYQNKVCLVTGAGSGIGRATALAFAREGGQVVAADVNAAAAAATAAAIAAAGGVALAVTANIGQRAEVEALVAQTVATYGRLDCAVNCAGIAGTLSLPTHEYPEDQWATMLQINLTGTWYCMQAELRQLLAQGGGTIVNVASAAGLVGQPDNVPYAVSKHGVVGLTRTAAIEYATQNIRVNAVCPTAIETPMLLDGRRQLRHNPAQLEAAKNFQRLKRMGQPEEVADVILWLCSPQSSFITGHALAVDGGAFA